MTLSLFTPRHQALRSLRVLDLQAFRHGGAAPVTLRSTAAEVAPITFAEASREHHAADERFQAALVAAHGRKAGDMRYAPQHDTPAIAEARAAFHAVGEVRAVAFEALMRAQREA